MTTTKPEHRNDGIISYLCVAADVKLGRNVKLSKFINLYGCEIGDETKIGAFVEVQKNATIGKRCKISSHSFVCEGVTIEDNVFIGPNATFTNDKFPRSRHYQEADRIPRTVVKRGASIGANATILPGITVGERAMVGAGADCYARCSARRSSGWKSRAHHQLCWDNTTCPDRDSR